MNTKRIIKCKTRVFGACLAALMAWAELAAGPVGYAQTTPANLSPDLQEIVKFAQAHMSDDVVLSYIKNSNKVYNVSGEDMLYLMNQGVSQPVLNALLQTKNNAAAPVPAPTPAPVPNPTPVPPPAYTPPPGPAPAPVYVPPPGLSDNFFTDAGLNPSVWTTQSPLLQSLAQWNSSAPVPALLGFSPAGMQMSGVNGPGQFAGIQSVGAFMAPFTLTTTVSGLAAEGIPFEVYLVSPDLRQFLTVAGHLGGIGGGPRGGLSIRTPFGGGRILGGGGPSPEYGVWANYTGNNQSISALGNMIYPAPIPRVPYTITMTVGPDGMGSVSFQDPSGVSLGTLPAVPVGTGPFNVVLASRKFGPTFSDWRSVQLTPLGAPPAPAAMTAPPETPTLGYFQAHLGPYGQWVDVPDIGSAWVPLEANNPEWRPYMDAGHWEFTDAGWYWQSDYPWGDIAFHYGRWINNLYTGSRWAWVPAYDWAPSWVAWREGEGGLGWAPLPWGVEFRPGLGLFWHGGLVVEGGVGIDFGLGFDAFVFVGADHFWGGNYRGYAFDRVHARAFYEHSSFHAGYLMEGGRLHAEGLGRERVAAITRHPVEERKAGELRRTEENRNFNKRAEEHPAITHAAPAERDRPGAIPTGSHPTAGGGPTTTHATPGGLPTTSHTAPGGLPTTGHTTPGSSPTTGKGSTKPSGSGSSSSSGSNKKPDK